MGASKVDSILPTKIPHQTQKFRQLASKLVPAVLSRDLYRLTQQLQKIERIVDEHLGQNKPVEAYIFHRLSDNPAGVMEIEPKT